MTIEHNVVVVGGLEYKAVIDAQAKGCSFCALERHLDENGECDEPCVPPSRNDKCNVIFKRHYRPTHKELQK